MSEDEIFACQKCDKKFTTKFSLNRHQFIHSQVKRFTCKFCPKKFALKQYLKEHECIHTNSRPYVCGVNGCQMRFRQRGKLSLHRRKHKGYKMKEYTLIGKKHENTEEFSETETFENKSHQNIEESYHEDSEVNEQTMKSVGSHHQVVSKKKKKTKEGSCDTDSEFELPSYSTKKLEDSKRPLRLRKASYKQQLNEAASSNSEEIEPSVSEGESENHLNQDSSYERPNSNLLAVPVDKRNFRKYSNDSTLDGSHCGKKLGAKNKKEHSRFSKNQQLQQKPNPNFECLVKAFKICQNLNNAGSNWQNKCEEKKIATQPDQPCLPSLGTENVSLNNMARYLNLSWLDSLHTGNDVNNYFSHIRDVFNLK